MTKYTSLREDFDKALARFEEILIEEKSDIVRDSAIKRFEIIFDLAWKITKVFLEEEHTTTCVSPRSCFREAFRVGLIPYDKEWMTMTSERNYTVHMYKEALAEAIYTGLPQALGAFKELANALP